MGKNAADRKDDKNWKSILKNYTLMQNPHYESDAQNWHIIGVESVSIIAFFEINTSGIKCYHRKLTLLKSKLLFC